MPSFGGVEDKQRRGGDNRSRNEAGLLQKAGVKPCHSPTTLTGYGTTFYDCEDLNPACPTRRRMNVSNRNDWATEIFSDR